MVRRAPKVDPVDDIEVGHPKKHAVGLPAVLSSAKHALDQMGPLRATRTLLQVNQKNGFDCPGCAWPEEGHRHKAEFCENGVKAVANEATDRRVERAFFAEHSLADLEDKSGYWLEQQGRLTEPMVKRSGGTHYEPISWAGAYRLISDQLHAMQSPDRGVFYTSGRTSNEAAYLYQLLVRMVGTNNLPDCSNMCHESSGAALNSTIGVGKGTVTIEDFAKAQLILVVGQNPGTNHPRMLTTLQAAKKAGAQIVMINPLPEAGLKKFRNPQTPAGLMGFGTELADGHIAVKVGGDHALFAALNHLLVERDSVKPGSYVDRDFVELHSSGYEEFAAAAAELDVDELVAAAGITRWQLDSLVERSAAADRIVVCWAMGLTQHKRSVPTIKEIVNYLILRGSMGKEGAGPCPVRGHSNVQGDRTMGIWEQMPESFHAALDKEFGIHTPREHGYDVVAAIEAMRDGDVDVFLGMGGNFASATPDTPVTEAAMRRCGLTVQVSTKLNRGHIVTGDQALILPCLGRTERDQQAHGEQAVTVEDSMGAVHRSHGRLKPASDQLKSEVSIVCGIGTEMFGSDPVDWQAFAADYDRIRDSIARVVPGFVDFNYKVSVPGGFLLPNAVRDECRFVTESGKATFTPPDVQLIEVPPGRLLLQTLRSHDQYNTTIYGLQDRYRGISGGRHVVFVSPSDLVELDLVDGDMVDLVSEWHDGDRRAYGFRVVSYPTAKGCAAAYYPETNVLVPLDSMAETSRTPTSKSIIVRLERVRVGADRTTAQV
jgi:formate dehydrogenase major subunit